MSSIFIKIKGTSHAIDQFRNSKIDHIDHNLPIFTPMSMYV